MPLPQTTQIHSSQGFRFAELVILNLKDHFSELPEFKVLVSQSSSILKLEESKDPHATDGRETYTTVQFTKSRVRYGELS